MKKRLIFTLLFLYLPSVYAQYSPVQDKPPLKTGKVAMELVVSTVAGAGLALASMYVYANFNKNSSGWDQLAETILVGGIAYPVGNTLGAYFAGNTGNEKGSSWATLGGSAAGVAVSVGLISLIQSENIGFLYLILPPAGAVIGHNLSRERVSSPGNALLNYKDGRFTAGIPALHLKRHPQYNNRFTKQYRIFSIKF